MKVMVFLTMVSLLCDWKETPETWGVGSRHALEEEQIRVARDIFLENYFVAPRILGEGHVEVADGEETAKAGSDSIQVPS